MTLIDLGNTFANIGLAALTIVSAAVVVFQAVSRLAFERLDIQAIVAKDLDIDVDGMREIIRSELLQLEDEGGGSSPFLINGPDMPLDLPGTVKTTQVDALAQIIAWLPGRITTISGRVHAEGLNGFGISVTLVGAFGRTKGSVTIWERDLDIPRTLPVLEPDLVKPERCQRLAVAAAAWVAYRLLADMPAAARSPLLTQDWRSYTIFRVAARMQRQAARKDAVRAMYKIALKHDPSNRGALFNLGTVYGDDAANYMAIQAFDACVTEVKRASDPSDDWKLDRLWYRAHFNGGVARANEATLRETPGPRRGTQSTSKVPGAAIPDVPGFTTGDLRAQAQERFRDVSTIADETIRDLAGGLNSAELGQRGEFIRFLVEMRSLGVAAFQATI